MPIPRPSRSELQALAEPLGLHLEGAELDQQLERLDAAADQEDPDADSPPQPK